MKKKAFGGAQGTKSGARVSAPIKGGKARQTNAPDPSVGGHIAPIVGGGKKGTKGGFGKK